MHDTTQIQSNSINLVEDLKARTRVEVEQPPKNKTVASKPEAKPASNFSIIDAWTTTDVTEWLLKIGVKDNVARKWCQMGVDGRALKGLVLLRHDRSLATTLKHDMAVRNPIELLHIVSELDRLSG